jgi:hypothetical protein
MSLLDARGCLTDEGLAQLAAASPGQAPSEAAAHLASCARCQDRLLARERAPGAADRPARAPAPYRNLALVAGLLLLTLLLLGVTLAYLSGR